jgi:ribosomal protein S18 acetylase RimI-like enzyme
MIAEATIREATAADVGAIQQIAHETWSSTYEGIIPRDVQQRALASWYATASLANQIELAGSLLLLAETKETAVGFAQFTVRPGELGELARIYVLPSYQGTGIGSRLLERGLTWLRALGVRRLIVEVEELNPIGRGFYDHHGFTELRVHKEDLFGHELSTVTCELALE